MSYAREGMNYRFEDFLQEWHMKDYHGTKDDYEAHYEDWMSQQDVESMEKLGGLYGKEMFIRGVRHGGDVAIKAIRA